MQTLHKYYAVNGYIDNLKDGKVKLSVKGCCNEKFLEKTFNTRKQAITFFRKRWGYESSPPLYYGDNGFDERLKEELARY